MIAKVAVLDDSETYRNFLSAVINTQPTLQAVATGNVGELESVLRNDEISCVLLDYHLGGYNGLEARTRLSGKVAFPPTILMTGDVREEVTELAKQTGVNIAFRKQNVRPKQIIDIISIVVKHRSNLEYDELQSRGGTRFPVPHGDRLSSDAPQASLADRARPDAPGARPNVDPIAGWVLLANDEEVPCTAVMRSPFRGEITTPRPIALGQVVVCAFDKVGILVGRIVGTLPRGVLVDFMIKENRRDKIAARLEWHAEHALRAAQLRGAPRIVPTHRAVAVRLAETVILDGTILDVSMSGAAITLQPDPGLFVGTLVRTGSRFATVTRTFEGGVAVQFAEPFTVNNFDERIRL